MTAQKKFKEGDRVRVAEDATWDNGFVSFNLKALRGKIANVTGHTDEDVILNGNSAVAPRFLTLVKDEAPTITQEQRDAFKRMSWYYKSQAGEEDRQDWDAIASALPEELTNPALPSKTGWYEAGSGNYVVWIEDGKVYLEKGTHPIGDPERLTPFAPLSFERPKVTAEQLRSAYLNGGGWVALADTINGSTQ